jgi:peptidoglycan/LPS O-acetylase OafA/YrhL
MQEDKNRFESLDSLRGIAAITVICSHFNLDYFLGGISTPFKNTPLHIFYDGEAAVVFFFVLSGFVLSYKYLKNGAEKLDKLSLSQFFIARIFRLYPLFWTVLILTALAATQLYHEYRTIPERTWTFWWWRNSFDPGDFLKQASLLYDQGFFINLFGRHNDNLYIPQGWTLETELILSLMVPFMVVLVYRSSYWLIAFVLSTIFLFNAPVYMVHFGMGILLAKYLPQLGSFMLSRKKIFQFLALLVGLFLYSYRYSVAIHFPTQSVLQIILFSPNAVFFFVGAGSVIIILSALHSVRLRKMLSAPLMSAIGKSSYGIYLCHTLILTVFTPMLIYWLNNHGIINSWVIITTGLVFTITVSILLAFILHHLIELPFIRWGKRFQLKS